MRNLVFMTAEELQQEWLGCERECGDPTNELTRVLAESRQREVESEQRRREERPDINVVMMFDPLATECPHTKAIFTEGGPSLTLYLLWRRNHITSDHFPAICQRIGQEIAKREPATVEALRECFCFHHIDMPPYDINRFVPDAFPFFRGQRLVGYTVVREGKP